MPLRSKLTVKQSQRLVMTPSLQNSLRILQLNQQELAQELQNLLLSNIMLEVDRPDSASSVDPEQDHYSDLQEERPLDLDQTETRVEMEEYDDYFNDDYSTALSQAEVNELDPLNQLTEAHQPTILEDLLWQLSLTDLTEGERLIGEVMIREINADGYLLTPLAEIVEMLTDQFPTLEERDLLPILETIQTFDPPGIAAQSVEESLLIQIERLTPPPNWADDAKLILTKGVTDLARVNIGRLSELINRDEAAVREILDQLHYLNPRPGYREGSVDQGGVAPDLIVTIEENQQLKVALNESIIPRLRINPFYLSLMRKMEQKEGMMSEHLAEARNVIRNIGSRFETLLLVGREIVEYQQAYFFEGDRALRPLQLKDIADQLGFNESTISRAVSGKYLLSPHGMLELNFFFSNQVAATDRSGEDASAVAIRALLQSIIDEENPEKPHSDAKLAKLLADAGHKVARRTVAKYREVLNIPSSTNRRSVAR